MQRHKNENPRKKGLQWSLKRSNDQGGREQIQERGVYGTQKKNRDWSPFLDVTKGGKLRL